MPNTKYRLVIPLPVFLATVAAASKLEASSIASKKKTEIEDIASQSQEDLYEQDFEDGEYDSSSSTIKTDFLDEEQLSPSPVI